MLHVIQQTFLDFMIALKQKIPYSGAQIKLAKLSLLTNILGTVSLFLSEIKYASYIMPNMPEIQ